jgi:hypothetical protein
MNEDDEKIMDVDFYLPMIVKTEKSKYIFFYNSDSDELIPSQDVPNSIIQKMQKYMEEMKDEILKQKEDANVEQEFREN